MSRINEFIQADPDTVNSTFRHVLLTYKNGKISTIIGYSKKIGFAETRNKRYLLEKILPKLYYNYYQTEKYGQLGSIEIYERNLEGVETKVLEMSTETQPIGVAEYVQFARKVMNAHYTKQRIEILLPIKTRQPSNVQNLLSNTNFKTLEELKNYCKKIMEVDHLPKGIVLKYYHDTKKKFI
jgi:predicted transcriptional regulator